MVWKNVKMLSHFSYISFMKTEIILGFGLCYTSKNILKRVLSFLGFQHSREENIFASLYCTISCNFKTTIEQRASIKKSMKWFLSI